MKFLWNKEHTQSAKASAIREINIYDAKYEFSDRKPKWKVLGWYNKNEDFLFGYFDTIEEAEQFVEKLHEEVA